MTADPEGAGSVRRAGQPDRQAADPTVTMHTSADPLVIVQNESVFRERVFGAKGRTADVLQLYTLPPSSYPTDPGAPYGAGHCNFTTEQRLGVVEVLDGWVREGVLPGSATVAEAFPGDESVTIDLQPRALADDRSVLTGGPAAPRPEAAQPGSRRNTARGSSRSTVITTRRTPGTHTTSGGRARRPGPRPPPASGVGANGASGRPLGHPGADEAGPDGHDRYPGAREGGAEALGDARPAPPWRSRRRSSPRGRAPPATEERTTSTPCPCARRPAAACSSADTGRRSSPARSHGATAGSASAGLVAEHAERHQHDVDVARRRNAVAQRARASRSAASKRRRDRPRRHAERARTSARRGASRVGGPTGQHHPAQPAARPAARTAAEADLRRAAEHQERLRAAEGVDHRRSLLARSERKTPAGSSCARTRLPLGRARGYMVGSSSGRRRASLAR